MVWCFVLYEHAGELLVSTLWAGGILPEICGTGSYFTDRHLPWVLAVHLLAVVGLGRAVDLAGDHHLILAIGKGIEMKKSPRHRTRAF